MTPEFRTVSDAAWISIVHWNGGSVTIRCLESAILEHREDRIVLVDNGSLDDIVVQVRNRWPTVVCLVNLANRGFTGGHNQAISYAMAHDAAYVILLNQDARLRSGCVERMLRLASSDARIGLVSPVIYYSDDASRVQFCGTWIDFDRCEIGGSHDCEVMREYQSRADSKICLWGTALMLRGELIREIGMLDDRFFAYFEDTDLSVRALRAGWLARVAFDASVDHDGHATRYTRGPHFFYLMSRNSLLFWNKAFSSRAARWRAHLKVVAKIVHEAAVLQDARLPELSNACIDGLWAGWKGHYGAFDDRIVAPSLLRRVLMRHPYLWWRLLNGDLRGLLRDGYARAKRFS